MLTVTKLIPISQTSYGVHLSPSVWGLAQFVLINTTEPCNIYAVTDVLLGNPNTGTVIWIFNRCIHENCMIAYYCWTHISQLYAKQKYRGMFETQKYLVAAFVTVTT